MLKNSRFHVLTDLACERQTASFAVFRNRSSPSTKLTKGPNWVGPGLDVRRQNYHNTYAPLPTVALQGLAGVIRQSSAPGCRPGSGIQRGIVPKEAKKTIAAQVRLTTQGEHRDIASFFLGNLWHARLIALRQSCSKLCYPTLQRMHTELAPISATRARKIILKAMQSDQNVQMRYTVQYLCNKAQLSSTTNAVQVPYTVLHICNKAQLITTTKAVQVLLLGPY